MLHARAGHTATLLKDGTVLIAGGFESWPTPIADAELFDPRTGAFTITGKMFVPRIFHAAVLLKDGRVLIVGGLSKPRNESIDLAAEAVAEIYDPETHRFTPATELTQSRWGTSALRAADGSGIIFGGRCASAIERFTPSTMSFRIVGYDFFQEIGSSPAVTPSGRIVAAGGGYCSGRGDFSVSDITVSDDGGVNFVFAGRLNDSRMFHTTTSIAAENLLVIGGFARDFNPSARSGILDSAEIVDAATGIARRVGSLHDARSGHSAALLATGEVLVVGGGPATTEIYDPVTETFHVAGSLAVARFGAPLIVTHEQRIFLFGGGLDNGGVLASIEEFVPGVIARRRAAR